MIAGLGDSLKRSAHGDIGARVIFLPQVLRSWGRLLTFGHKQVRSFEDIKKNKGKLWTRKSGILMDSHRRISQKRRTLFTPTIEQRIAND
jgi:predicted DNA-binding WGR domain protein